MPLLVFGLALLSAITLVEDLDAPIYALLSGSDPESPSTPGVAAYTVLKSLVRLFGLVYVAAGVAATRRLAATRAQRPLSVWLIAVTIVAIVITPLGLSSVFSASTFVDLVAAAIGLLLTLLVNLGWAYFVSTTIGGWRAGEAPNRAWMLGALATSILFVHRLFAQLSLWFGEAAFGMGEVASYIGLAAWVLLLVAFAIGLPMPAPMSTAAPDATPGAARAGRPGATPPGSGAG